LRLLLAKVGQFGDTMVAILVVGQLSTNLPLVQRTGHPLFFLDWVMAKTSQLCSNLDKPLGISFFYGNDRVTHDHRSPRVYLAGMKRIVVYSCTAATFIMETSAMWFGKKRW
jgi:hypothetical protein